MRLNSFYIKMFKKIGLNVGNSVLGYLLSKLYVSALFVVQIELGIGMLVFCIAF